jgi:hypothetical protein
MKSKLLLAFTAGLLLCPTRQKAQVSAYSFTQTVSSYGSPNTGTLVGALLQDDDVNTVGLPFSFSYNGNSYSSINVAANGNLSFNNLTGTEYTPISDNTTTNVISPFGQDLIMGSLIMADMTTGSNTLTNCSSVNGFSVGDVIFDYNSDFGSVNPTITAVSGSVIVVNINAQNTNTGYTVVDINGYIKQNVSGTSPNRICEFEYANFSRYGIYDEVINFKVRLYETSNNIEFLYGTMIPGQSTTPSEVGLKGSSNSDYNTRTVNSSVTWSTSVASSQITDYCDFDPTTFPLSGQSYKWAPVTCTVPVLAVTPSNTVICSGSTVTLTASGATTYSWSNGPSTAQQTITPMMTTSYTLTGANLTCTSSITYTLNVTQNPTLTISSSNSTICPGQSATLTASGASTYSWTNGPSNIPQTVSPSVTTSYTLIGANSTCTSSVSYIVNVDQYPVLNIAMSNSAICPGQSATLTAIGATTYSWNGVSNPAQFVISPTVTTTYSLTGSNGSNCSSTLSIVQIVANCTGISEVAGKEESLITAYPNPFNAMLYVKNTTEKDQPVTISDALGKTVYTALIKAGSVETISSDFLSSGLYFISVSSSNGTSTKKLIKQ